MFSFSCKQALINSFYLTSFPIFNLVGENKWHLLLRKLSFDDESLTKFRRETDKTLLEWFGES